MKKEPPKVVEGRRFDRGVWVVCHACQGFKVRTVLNVLGRHERIPCDVCGGKGKLWKRL